MIKKILIPILFAFSIPTFAAEPPLSNIFEGLLALSKRISVVKKENSEKKTFSIEETLQAIGAEDQKLQALRKEVEGLKQQYAADLQGDEKPQKMGRKATQDILSDIDLAEKDIAQGLALAAATGVIRSSLEESKKKTQILDYSIEVWNEWSLPLKGFFKNYPTGAYPIKDEKEAQALDANARGVTVEYLDKEKRLIVHVELIVTSTVQSFEELKELLKTSVPGDGIQKILSEKDAHVNVIKGEPGGILSLRAEPNEYYYGLVMVEQSRFASKAAE